jgi:hypothetical protein
MGSVAEGVVRHAPCSVQIVRIPMEAPTHLAVSSNERGWDVGNPEGKIQTPIAVGPEQDKQICKVCGKPSSSVICPVCADKIRAEAVARKRGRTRAKSKVGSIKKSKRSRSAEFGTKEMPTRQRRLIKALTFQSVTNEIPTSLNSKRASR